jgi:hypothetical protein
MILVSIDPFLGCFYSLAGDAHDAFSINGTGNSGVVGVETSVITLLIQTNTTSGVHLGKTLMKRAGWPLVSAICECSKHAHDGPIAMTKRQRADFQVKRGISLQN